MTASLLSESSGVTSLERFGQFLAVHLTRDQPAGRGGECEADMLMAVAAIDVGQARRATNRWAEIRKAGPLADPAAALRTTDAGEDLLEMPHQKIGAMPGRRLMRRGQFDGAGHAQPFRHWRDEETAFGGAYRQVEAHIVGRQHDVIAALGNQWRVEA